MRGLRVGIVVMVIAFGGAGCKSSQSADTLKYDAFNVCTQFVKARLKSPSTATFRDPTANNGDTVITPSSDGQAFVITSSVDSENGFGAKLRSTYTCAVKHTTGSEFTLASLDIQDGGDTGP